MGDSQAIRIKGRIRQRAMVGVAKSDCLPPERDSHTYTPGEVKLDCLLISPKAHQTMRQIGAEYVKWCEKLYTPAGLAMLFPGLKPNNSAFRNVK